MSPPRIWRSGDLLLVPTGRAVPAAFDRRSGQFRYFHLQQNGKLGGSEITAGERWFLNSQSAFDLASGARHASFPKLAAPLTAITPRQIVHWQSGKLDISRSQEKSAPDRRGAPAAALDLEPLWSAPCPHGGNALIVAGAKAVSAGRGPGGFGIDLVNLEAREPSATVPLEEEPLGLAAAAGRLYVATASGTILCLRPADRPQVRPEVERGIRNQITTTRRPSGRRHRDCIDLTVAGWPILPGSHLRIVRQGRSHLSTARRRFDGPASGKRTLFAAMMRAATTAVDLSLRLFSRGDAGIGEVQRIRRACREGRDGDRHQAAIR